MEFLLHSAIPGYILALIGIIASIFFGVKSKRIKRLSFYKRTKWLIMPGKAVVPDLQILYHEKELNEISVTTYTIWNSGNETIQKADIVPSRPIMVGSSTNEILDAQIIKSTEESCLSRLDTSDDRVTISFDYLDPLDGFVLQIIHSGDLSIIDGKIKGGIISSNNYRKHINRISKLTNFFLSKNGLRVSYIFITAFLLTLSVVFLIVFYGVITNTPELYDFLFYSKIPSTPPSTVSIAIFLVVYLIF